MFIYNSWQKGTLICGTGHRSIAVLFVCTPPVSYNTPYSWINTYLISTEVTSLIYQYAEEFDSTQAIAKMKNGRNWPRSMCVATDVDFRMISNMLTGLDFRGQADLVASMREERPDTEYICRLLQESKNECEDLDEIIKMITLTDDEILLMWECSKTHAANSGTWMHAMLEHHYNGNSTMAGSMQGELDAATEVIQSLGVMEVYRTEWCIYATEEDLALVLRDPVSDMLYLVAWKRKYKGYGKYMKPPLHQLADCQGEHYRLQLNIYRWMLEKYYGVRVAAMKVVCVHPRYLPHGFVDDVPDLQDQVTLLMQGRRDELHARKIAQPPSEPRLADTQPFNVVMASQASEDSVQRDIQTQLQELLEDVPEPPVKRRHFTGASAHSIDFHRMLQRSDEILRATLDVYKPDACLRPNTILHNTKRLLSEIQTCYPFLSEELARLILVATRMTEGVIGEKLMLADSAAVTWMIEGQRRVRVHKGFMYIYDDDGCFLPFNGIPPEAVLQRVHAFFTYLEGIFRRMKPEISRKADSVAKAVVADLQTFTSEDEFLAALREATSNRSNNPYPSRLDAEEEDEEQEDPRRAGKQAKTTESWTVNLADRAFKLSCNIRHELMQTRMVSLLVEWCETEDMRSSSVCYNDICFTYDEPGSVSPVKVVKKGPENNCYIRIPHPLLDPVLEANKQRLRLFYERTFWCNMDVFRCFQSATAIAKRGFNVDRCFIGISPGGVGQSLHPG